MHTSINDFIFSHFLPLLTGFLFVYPIGLKPVVIRDEAELNFGVCNFRNTSADIGLSGL